MAVRPGTAHRLFFDSLLDNHVSDNRFVALSSRHPKTGRASEAVPVVDMVRDRHYLLPPADVVLHSAQPTVRRRATVQPSEVSSSRNTAGFVGLASSMVAACALVGRYARTEISAKDTVVRGWGVVTPVGQPDGGAVSINDGRLLMAPNQRDRRGYALCQSRV